MDFPRHAVEEVLKRNDCEKFGEYRDHEIWITKDFSIIQLPKGKTIHSDLVEPIFMGILGMGIWDYDYWLGQNGVA